MKDMNNFYKELGNLFYAVAKSDDKIKPDEKKKIEDLIEFNWKHLENTHDEFGTDASYIILFEFETARDQGMTTEEAYNFFAEYFRDNENALDDALRKRIFESCRQIADSYRRINARELELLEKIQDLLQINKVH